MPRNKAHLRQIIELQKSTKFVLTPFGYKLMFSISFSAITFSEITSCVSTVEVKQVNFMYLKDVQQ